MDELIQSASTAFGLHWPGVETASHLCRTCTGLVRKPQSTMRKIFGTNIGSIQDVRGRADGAQCAGCKLIVQMLQQDAGVFTPAELQHIRLHQPIGEMGDGMGLTAGSKLVGYVHIHRHNGPLVGLSKELVERAKELVETPELDMKLLRGWIETCEIMHGETCNKPMTLRGANTIEILLIDVLEHKVVFSDTSTRYLALSYVWGRAPVFMTTMDTLTDVLQPGFLDDKLSQVVADAMRVVEGLKERYLWVDTICIVQDDPDHKVAQIQNMDIIYGRSVATIAAASGTCSGDPLPGVSPSTRHPPSYVEPSPEATFVSQAPALYKFTSDSIYESRAWTFQERILSRRCLFFTRRQVYFQCCSDALSEHQPDRVLEVDTDLKLQESAVNNALVEFRSHVTSAEESAKPVSWTATFQVFRAVILQYTKRQMTNLSDVLNALAGISAALESLGVDRFVSGIPEGLLPMALLWIPTGPARRRLIEATATEPASDLGLPSWSWAAWITPVDFLLQFNDGYFTDLYGHATSFRIEMRLLGIESQGVFRHLQMPDHFQSGIDTPEPQQHSSPLPTEVLHIWALVIDAKRFWKQGGKFNTSDGTSSIFEPKSRVAKFVLNKVDAFTSLKDNDYMKQGIIPVNYINYFPFPPPSNLYSDASRWEFVLLSSNKYFPPNGGDLLRLLELAEDEEIRKELPGLRKNFGEEWAMLNVMLIKWTGPYAERVMVGHIPRVEWEKASPSMTYVRLG